MSFAALVRDFDIDALRLTWRETAIMELLGSDFCGASTSTLAHELNVSRQWASWLVGRLVHLDLVSRVTDSHDRRCVRLTLTDRGITVWARIASAMQEKTQ